MRVCGNQCLQDGGCNIKVQALPLLYMCSINIWFKGTGLDCNIIFTVLQTFPVDTTGLYSCKLNFNCECWSGNKIAEDSPFYKDFARDIKTSIILRVVGSNWQHFYLPWLDSVIISQILRDIPWLNSSYPLKQNFCFPDHIITHIGLIYTIYFYLLLNQSECLLMVLAVHTLTGSKSTILEILSLRST